MRWLSSCIIGALLIAGAAFPAVAGTPQPFVSGSWEAIRKAHDGQPVIVHFWGVTCGPCRAEMPEWGKLLAERPGTPLVVVHAEPVPPKAALVSEQLAKVGLVPAENWYFAERFLEKLRFEIDPEWRGELPMTLLMGADGASRVIIGPADLGEVRQWLAERGR